MLASFSPQSAPHWRTLARLVAYAELEDKGMLVAEPTCASNIHDTYQGLMPDLMTRLQKQDNKSLHAMTQSVLCALFWSVAYYLSQRYHTLFPLNYRRIFLMCLAISAAGFIFAVLPISKRVLSPGLRGARNALRPPKITDKIDAHFQGQRQAFIRKSEKSIGEDFTFLGMITSHKKDRSALNSWLSDAQTTLESKKDMFTDEDARSRVITIWKEIWTSRTLTDEDKALCMAIALELHKRPNNGVTPKVDPWLHRICVSEEDASPAYLAWLRLQGIEADLNTTIHLKGMNYCRYNLLLLMPDTLKCAITATIGALMGFAACKIAHRVNPALQENMLWLIVFSTVLSLYLVDIIQNLMRNPYDHATFKLGTFEGWNEPCNLSPVTGGL